MWRNPRVSGFLALVFPIVIATSCTPAAPARASHRAGDELAGTWRVVQFVEHAPADTVPVFPFGHDPNGYLVYDGTGHVFFQVVRPGAVDSLRTGLERGAPAADVLRLMEGYAAFFGTYVVDTLARTVTHHPEGELPIRRGQYEVATPFRVNGDSLVLGVDNVRAWRFVRVHSP